MKGFVNPYNFISFPEKKAHAYKDTDKHTGFIEYTITTETPLFIPNSSSESAFEDSKKVADHKSYDFFSYEDLEPTKNYEKKYFVPVVPGSEIRGVVRSVYETLTDSCMGVLNSEEYVVKRSVARFHPGLLYKEKNKLILYGAKSYRIDGKELSKYPNGKLLYKKPSNNIVKPVKEYNERNIKNFTEKGYLLKWGMGVNKKYYHLFTCSQKEKTEIDLLEEDVIQKMNSVIDSYMSQPNVDEKNQKAYKEYKDDFEEFFIKKEQNYFPVNYSIVNEKQIYLAPAVFTKEVSNVTIGELAGEFAPCEKDYCPACDLFGYTGKTNESSRSSKIRFTDLYVTEEKEAQEYYLCDKVTLQTLGGPKPGNVDFYLERPENAKFWTYDYYVTQGGNLKIQKGKLRGRKYYWHHRNVVLPKEVEPSNLNKTVRPVKKGVSFEGRLYFEKISERQLKQLVWILNSSHEELALKLGGAKPLGFGSISCKVKSVKERKIGLENGGLSYKVEEKKPVKVTYEDAGFSKEVKAEFYKITGLKSIPEKVEITYPKMENQKNKELSEGFRWFVKNHSSGKMPNKREDAQINLALPGILEEDFSLPYYKE